MAESGKWRDGVAIVRAPTIDAQVHAPDGAGRATAFDFAGTGAERTWIGRVSVRPGANTGPHHHGRHEVLVYVISGRSEIRWGDSLEFAAEIGAGDLTYFSPYVPHQERNLSDSEPVEFLVIRSDSEKIAIPLVAAIVEHPELVA